MKYILYIIITEIHNFFLYTKMDCLGALFFMTKLKLIFLSLLLDSPI